MPAKVGLWLDHSKAILVSLDGSEVATQTLVSDSPRKGRVKGGAPGGTPYGAQDATYEARRDRKYEMHLKDFYDSISRVISDADAILIFGPGQAKTELRKHLEASGVTSERLTTEPADKLTDAQIVEKVKLHFGYPTRATF